MVLKREMNYTPKGENRTLHIYLPDNYNDTDERYPVMYYFDGHNLFYDHDATYGKSWGLLEFLEDFPKNFIIVGIECSHDDRLNEYCPYDIQDSFLGHLNGMGKETMEWIVNEIKPMIDKEYRTYSFREATGIAGSSMGGLMSVYAIIKYNEVFSKAGCLSNAIRSCMKELKDDFDHTYIYSDTRVYLSNGENEGGSRASALNQEVASWFEEKGANTKVYLQPGGHHCEADWEKQNQLYYDFLWMNKD